MADKKKVASKNHSNQRSSSHTDTDRSSHRSTSTSRRSGSHNRERSDQRSSTVTSQPDQGRPSSRSNQSSTSYRSRPRSVVTRIDEGPTEQTRSDLPPRRRRRSVSRSRRTVYSRSESTQSSRARVHEHSPASSTRSLNEQVIRMLKELYSFVDFNTIKRIVETTASSMEVYSQGLLLESSSRKVREMMAAACGVSAAPASSASVPVVSAPRATVVAQPKEVVESTKPKVTIPKEKSDKEPPKKVTSSTKLVREVTIKDVNNNNANTLKRSSSETLEVIVPKKKQKRHACYMTNCGQPSPSIKKHVVGKHLSIAFATWKEMPNEERMVRYNQSLMSLEAALGLSSHDELLQLVVKNKWFPVDTRFTIPEEDAKFVKAFHQWLTGNQLTSKPIVDPPNCVAVLTNWRVFFHCSQLHWGGEGNIT